LFIGVYSVIAVYFCVQVLNITDLKQNLQVQFDLLPKYFYRAG
jgi:hypothetical protein